MVVADEAGRYALKLTIGKGDVEFAVSVVAPRGSELCKAIPAVDYDYKAMGDYPNARGDLPWRTPLNAPFNIEFS